MLNQSLHVAIETLEMSRGLLDEEMKKRLASLISDKEDERPIQKFEVCELDTLYSLILNLQFKILTGDGELLADATSRDVASLIGATSALLRAFVSHQKTVDQVKEEADLKFAVLAAIETLDPENQQIFFETLESYA